jgi:hypothetical protein
MSRNEWQKRELNVHHVTQPRRLDDLKCEFLQTAIVPRLWLVSENAFESGNHATTRGRMTLCVIVSYFALAFS